MTIIITVLGDNNLRWFFDKPQHVLRMFEDLLVAARKIENCHIIISSLLPSIENKENCDQIFLEFDRKLKTILDPRNELLDLQKSLRNKMGLIKEVLYDDKQDVHLSDEGAEVLSLQVFNKVRRLPHKYFE